MSADTTSTERADAEGRVEPVLAISEMRVSYGRVKALDGIDLHVDEGEIVSVIGPNGAGKSSLAEAVAGFVPYDGNVTYRGAEVATHASEELVAEGLVLCTETRDLFPYMSVADNLELGAYRVRSGAQERLEYVYDLFPRLRERRQQDAETMSGGEQQMLAIGRALMSDPDLLLLDEPTLGLAPVILDDISDALDEIRDRGVSILLCEQNVTFAMNHADRIYLLENGEIRREGTPATMRGDDYIREVYLGG
ncbi:ABC transporter ATP-binding protein [Halorubellus salinus]|uniref:ABC transporter ATP-binding protein n=1 Tax=Halorubellus salinus TaxID=755309 RepID=UPI001D06F5AD|nr:ABC transporter ATP-binding protein [Halorubellus salinus]